MELLPPDNALQSPNGDVLLLSDYLLADAGECILVIGFQASALQWSCPPEQAIPLIHAECLAKAPASLAQFQSGGGLDVVSPMASPVALLAIDQEAEESALTLGLAVRLFPHRLIVHTGSTELADSDFFAFGFRKLDVVDDSLADQTVRWYEYRLRDYKPPPDWLNARFWANPERFHLDGDVEHPVDGADTDEEE